jgi:hypothetical protein
MKVEMEMEKKMKKGDEVEVEVESFEERRNIEGYEQRLIEAIEERADICLIWLCLKNGHEI